MGKQKTRKQRKQKANISAYLGGGLMLVGAALLLLLTQNEGTSSAQTPTTERSVTPMEVNFPAPELALERDFGGRPRGRFVVFLGDLEFKA